MVKELVQSHKIKGMRDAAEIDRLQRHSPRGLHNHQTSCVSSFLGAFAELRKATVSFVMSMRPHGANRLPLDGFSWNLTFEYFSKICRENSSFVKIWQEWGVLYMKTSIRLLSDVTQFFFEWKMFRTKFVVKTETHFIFRNFLFSENRAVYERIIKNIVEPDRPPMTIWRMRIAC